MASHNQTRVLEFQYAFASALVVIFSLIILNETIYFAVNTPFALIDDYTDWRALKIFSSWESAKRWLGENFGVTPVGRWRPHFEIINYLSWSTFGESYSAHHVFRLSVRLLTAFFAACTAYVALSDGNSGVVFRRFFLSLICFVVCQFDPIAPEARLAPVELWTGFYVTVGLFILVLTEKFSKYNTALLDISLFCVIASCLIVKEINFVFSVAFLFCTSVVFRRSNYLLFGQIILLLLAVAKVSQTLSIATYGKSDPATANILMNIKSTFSVLFYHGGSGSLLVPAVIVLLVTLGSFIGVIKRSQTFLTLEIDLKLLMAALCLLISFLGIALMFWRPALRYYYPAVPLISILLPVGFSRAITSITGLRAFTLACQFLICLWPFMFLRAHTVNYIYQFASQSVTRTQELALLDDAHSELINGSLVAVLNQDEFDDKFIVFFEEFLPYMGRRGFNVLKSDVKDLPSGAIFYRRSPDTSLRLKLIHQINSDRASNLRRRYDRFVGELGSIFNVAYWVDDGAPWFGDGWFKYLVNL